MFSVEALQYLAENQITAAPAVIGIKGEQGEIPVVMLPNSMSPIGVERFMAAPVRFRGEFKTKWISDFVRYLKKHYTPGTAIYINEDAMAAQAFIDHGTTLEPGWREFSGLLALQKNPEYEALLGHSNKLFTQQHFIEFVQDYSPHLTFFGTSSATEDAAMSEKTVIQAVSSMTVRASNNATTQVTNRSVANDSMESLETVARHGFAPPDGFDFFCIPYPDLDSRRIRCALTYPSEAGGQPRIRYRIVGHPLVVRLMAEEFTGRLTDSLEASGIEGVGGMIFMGTMK